MKKKGTWVILTLLVVLALLVGVFGCAQPAPTPTPTPKPTTTTTPTPTPTPTPVTPITLKAGGYGGPTYPLTIMMEEANKLIEQRSGGRIKIQWFPNESLVKQVDMYDAIPKGVLDIGITSAAYKEALGLPYYVMVLPFTWNVELFQQHYRDPGSWFDFQQSYWEKMGLRLLSQSSLGYLQLSCRTPIHALADFKGKLIRVSGLAQAVRLLGAEPVDLPASGTYEALQKGTIDGSVISFDSMRTLGVPEVNKYFTQWDMSMSSLMMIMGTKVRQTLPSDIVKLIDDAYLEAERNHNARLTGLLNDTIQAIKTYPGVVEIYQVPAAERALWKEKVKPMIDDAAKKVGADWDRFLPIMNSLSK